MALKPETREKLKGVSTATLSDLHGAFASVTVSQLVQPRPR